MHPRRRIGLRSVRQLQEVGRGRPQVRMLDRDRQSDPDRKTKRTARPVIAGHIPHQVARAEGQVDRHLTQGRRAVVNVPLRPRDLDPAVRGAVIDGRGEDRAGRHPPKEVDADLRIGERAPRIEPDAVRRPTRQGVGADHIDDAGAVERRIQVEGGSEADRLRQESILAGIRDRLARARPARQRREAVTRELGSRNPVRVPAASPGVARAWRPDPTPHPGPATRIGVVARLQGCIGIERRRGRRGTIVPPVGVARVRYIGIRDACDLEPMRETRHGSRVGDLAPGRRCPHLPKTQLSSGRRRERPRRHQIALPPPSDVGRRSPILQRVALHIPRPRRRGAVK